MKEFWISPISGQRIKSLLFQGYFCTKKLPFLLNYEPYKMRFSYVSTHIFIHDSLFSFGVSTQNALWIWKSLLRIGALKYNASQKHESTLLHTYVMNEFLTAVRSFTTKYFWKSLIEVGSSHLYASFGTFCVQIGQLVEVQWDFKLSEEFEINVIFHQKQRFYRFHTFFKDSLSLE